MATLRQLVSSVDIQLGQLSDDSKVPITQLYLWGMWLVNKYRSYKYQTTDSGAYLTILPSVAVTVPTADVSPDIISAENYSVLPQAILDIEGDRGIDYISYSRSYSIASVAITSAGTVATVVHADHGFTSGDEVVIAGAVETEYNGRFTIIVIDEDSYSYTVAGGPASPATGAPTSVKVINAGVATRFTRTTAKMATRLNYSLYEVPSLTNPYWYRHGNYIGYLGLNKSSVTTVEVGIITAFDPFDPHDIDDNLDILTEYADEIFKDMIELGRFALLIPSDRVNDGSNVIEQEQVPQSRTTSVNKDVGNLFNNQQEQQ